MVEVRTGMAGSGLGSWTRLAGSGLRSNEFLTGSRSAAISLRSQPFKKLREYSLALFFEHASDDLDTVVQTGFVRKVEHRSTRPRLRISRAEHEPRDPCQDNGPETHGARLERHKQRRIDQPPPAKSFRTFLDHDEFRMGRRILPGFAMIMSSSEDGSLMHEDRPDRDFSDGSALCGLFERRAHEHQVFFA
jgi:hypothetical protein